MMADTPLGVMTPDEPPSQIDLSSFPYPNAMTVFTDA